MKKCKSCKAEIPSDVKKCSHCGADQRGWFRRHPILTGLGVIILVLIIAGVVGSSSKGGSNTSETTTNSTTSSNNHPETKSTPVVMDATSLVGEYDKNKLAAQDKYTGKIVQTTAFIDNISSDITGNYFLSLKPSNDQYYTGTTLQCFFADKSSLTSLSNGQSVTVAGTMQDMSLGIVEIKDCNLVK